MPSEIVTLPDGQEALVNTTGDPKDGIEVILLSVLASYSELLGEPDPAKTVLLIRGCMNTKDQKDMWGPLYTNLTQAVVDMMDSGVPPEFMPDVLEEAAPVPAKARRTGLKAAQSAVREKVGKNYSQNVQQTASFNALLVRNKDKIKAHRAAFLKGVAPEGRGPRQAKAMAKSPFETRVGRPTGEE